MAFLFWRKKAQILENRPWGNFEVLSKDGNITIKKIIVMPQKRLSYQSHNNRAEHWFITQGTGKVTNNDVVSDAINGMSFDIAIHAKHRIENTSEKDNLIFIEISTGDFNENDITRYEDDFGRK